ncbi:MAG TPA: RnfH family protein [Steroidobacteraceae bacterium]|nr:RnfH family protein [Steroidobacteraceae bacterium]
MLIEIVHAGVAGTIRKTYRFGAPASVADALRRAAADTDFAGVDCLRAAVGVFGLVVGAERVLQDGDRLEIYRSLAEDPKSARRRRAATARRR